MSFFWLFRPGAGNGMKQESSERAFLACEQFYIFELLILASGMFGAYTYNLRGGVFCNAQSANVVLMGLAFGKGEFQKGLYYLIPISAYYLGAFVSELLPKKVRKFNFLRWDTYLVGLEAVVIFIIGWLPLSTPVQIVQVMINFICSMQFNTFRQAEGTAMATTFVTNHIRQIGIWTANAVERKDSAAWKKALMHIRMVIVFFIGAAVLTFFCGIMQEHAIWLSLIPLLITFMVLAHADMTIEDLNQKPHGH